MFIITELNADNTRSVLAGPFNWNKYRFESIILDDADTKVILEKTNDPETYVSVSYTIEIWPVSNSPDPIYNSKIQRLHGPFYTYENNMATSHNVVENLPIEPVKNILKNIVASNRYTYENAGTIVLLKGESIKIKTDRTSRDVYSQKYLMMKDEDIVIFKIADAFFELSKSDMGMIASAIHDYVQSQFDWEAAKVLEIENCADLTALDAVNLSNDTGTK